MSVGDAAQYAVFLVVVTALVPVTGRYMARVFSGQHTWLDPGLRPIERAVYRITFIDPAHGMDWREYALCFVGFTVVGTLVLFPLLLIQSALPFYDAAYLSTPMTPDLAINVAVSFATT